MTTVQYRNSYSDVLWFNFHTSVRSPVMLIFLALFSIAMGFSANQSIPVEATPGIRAVLIVVMAATWLCILLVLVSVFVILATISKANRTFLTQHTITIAENVLIEETEFNRLELKWAGVSKVIRTRRHIIVYMAQYAGHVIPRRAFPDTTAWDTFFDNLRARAQK